MLLQKLLLVATISISSIGFAGSAVKEINLEFLKCTVKDSEVETLSYMQGHGEISFQYRSDSNGNLNGDHWDGFYFYKRKKGGRIYVVYHDGGEATEEGSDMYFDPNGVGKANQSPIKGRQVFCSFREATKASTGSTR
jgi:hypothetical protein